MLSSLNGSGYEWLAELLGAFNAGDLTAYDALCVKHAALLNAQPALVAAATSATTPMTAVLTARLAWCDERLYAAKKYRNCPKGSTRARARRRRAAASFALIPSPTRTWTNHILISLLSSQLNSAAT